jgi:hypothetical protein
MHLFNAFIRGTLAWGLPLLVAGSLLASPTVRSSIGFGSENDIWSGNHDPSNNPAEQVDDMQILREKMMTSDYVIGIAAANAPEGADLQPVFTAAKSLLYSPTLESMNLPDQLSSRWPAVKEKLSQAQDLANSPMMKQVVDLSNAVKGLGLSNLDYSQFQTGLMSLVKPDSVEPSAWNKLLGFGS